VTHYRALSLTPPWPYAMVFWDKDIENRPPGFSHKSFRGAFLIHQSGVKSRRAYDAAVKLATKLAAPELVAAFPMPPYDEVRADGTGIVGMASITGMVQPGESGRRWHFDDSVGFILEGAKPLPLIPCKGALGFWEVPWKIAAQVDGLRGGGG